MAGMRAVISSNIFSQLMLLKVLEKSRRRFHQSSGWMVWSPCTLVTAWIVRLHGGVLLSSYTLVTAWTMASHPTETPTPSCRGVRDLTASLRTARETHFEVSLCRTSPTAIGCRPPFFFFEANRIAPHRLWTTSRGAFPEHRQLITFSPGRQGL